MNEDEIKEHKLNKKKDASYPKLPKFILKNNKQLTQKHNESVLRGFYKRLNNWKLNKEIKTETTEFL